ncbi:hypothetical protein PROFUN_14945 [Planoprotostelium fungivorum]|uniref:Uncharacterized protein n=1 Tax=Planoprotostelium fungivorum TaxID=1890364 RepID=A0A2P6MYD9_9EUKA|nr:hypothetical protein PROFUN_14945 [Planoprotostelium fungivorum]
MLCLFQHKESDSRSAFVISSRDQFAQQPVVRSVSYSPRVVPVKCLALRPAAAGVKANRGHHHTTGAVLSSLFFSLGWVLSRAGSSIGDIVRLTTSKPHFQHSSQERNMKVAILFAIVFCLAVHADLTQDFPQPPYNVVETFTSGEVTSITCPADCGNPDSRHCLWNADIQNTCSATFAEKREVEEKRQTRCQQLHYCGPVCYSDGQGGYACGCVSCGK